MLVEMLLTLFQQFGTSSLDKPEGCMASTGFSPPVDVLQVIETVCGDFNGEW